MDLQTNPPSKITSANLLFCKLELEIKMFIYWGNLVESRKRIGFCKRFSALYRFADRVGIDYSMQRNIWHPLCQADNKTGFYLLIRFPPLVIILFNREKQENKNYLKYHNKRERYQEICGIQKIE